MGTFDATFIPIREADRGDSVVLRVRAKSYPGASLEARAKLRRIFREGESRRWMLSNVRQVIR